MAEMSPEDLEKLRRLEEEVDRERDDARKKREELEAKAAAARAVVPVAEKPAEKLPAVKPDDEGSKALMTDKDANAWRRGLQKKVAIGAGGVMLAYWLISNIFTIVCGVGVVAGAYYLSGKYLGGGGDDPKAKKKESAED